MKLYTTGMATIHRVIYQPRDRMWHAASLDAPDVVALGVTLDQAERNIRVAIATRLGDGTAPEDLRLRHQYDVPSDAMELILPSLAFKSGGADQRTEQRAAAQLVRTLGISLRDAARVLGISHTRVAQLLRSHDAGDPTRDRVVFTCRSCAAEFPHSVALELTPSGSIRQLPTEARCDRCGHVDTYVGDQIRIVETDES